MSVASERMVLTAAVDAMSISPIGQNMMPTRTIIRIGIL